MRRTLSLFPVLLSIGCGVHAPSTYRLVNTGLLIPPGVAAPNLPSRTFTVDIASGHGKCEPGEGALDLHPRGNRLRVTANRDALLRQPRGWLTRWTSLAEVEGCIAPGQGARLATSIVESLPLDARQAYLLLHPADIRAGYLDLGPEIRLEVDSPIVAEGTPADAPLIESMNVTGAEGRSLNVSVKTSSNLLGFEKAWYAVRPKPGGGYSITPISAERHIQGNTENAAAPAVNRLDFPPEAAWFRLYYKAEQEGLRIVVTSAPTRADLDRRTQGIETAADPCAQFPPRMCTVIPRGVALNPDVVVLANAREIAVPVGSSVRTALTAAGERRPESVLARLSIRRLYAGKPVRVEFDPTNPAALALPLLGGEELVW